MTNRVIIGDARNLDLSSFGQYGVIVADPPWDYHLTIGEGTVAEHYPTMADMEIAAMPIDKVSLENCALFLWGTWPKLPEALMVLKAWGFDYVTGFPWIKMTGGMEINYGVGYWVRGCSECVFIGRKGHVSPPRQKGFLGLLSPNVQHSRKPDSIHEIAEALPGPYLELFGRRRREGWDTFGNNLEPSSKKKPPVAKLQRVF